MTTTSKPERKTFDIATREGREQRVGYVLGDWAAHKEPGPGHPFWDFTHLPTGCSINVYPVHAVKASALAHLAVLNTTGPSEATKATLAEFGPRGWGLGMTAETAK